MTAARHGGYKRHHVISPVIGNHSIWPERTRILKGWLASPPAKLPVIIGGQNTLTEQFKTRL